MPAKGVNVEVSTVVEPDRTQQHPGVRLDGVRKAFGPVQALDGVSLDVRRGEVVAVVGPSGCGKSTLLDLVCGLAEPDAGSVAAAPATLMPQRDALLPWLSAEDNAGLALRVAGASRAQARAAARPYFAPFGLAGFERARPAELSGGMRQRVAFLRTLLAGTPVLCLDEPFGALDALTRVQMQEWLAGALEREHTGEPPAATAAHEEPLPGLRPGLGPRTVLLVTHDVEEAIVLADRVVLLSPRPGRVLETLTVDLPGPRRRTDHAVADLARHALDVLGVGG